MSRANAREGCMKLIYQMEMNQDFSEDSLKLFLENFEYNEEESTYVTSVILDLIKKLDKIDSAISKHAKSWRLARIAKVDLAILRIAVYELLFREDIPHQVSINEAIEISKKYSSIESFRFINGVLGSILQFTKKEEP